MKKLAFIYMLIGIITGSHAQISDTLELSLTMRVSVVFKSKIYDSNLGSTKVELRGSRDSLALKCRAKIKNFAPSNVLITTMDGRVYNFIIVYKDTPGRFYIPVNPQSAVNKDDFQAISPQEENKHQGNPLPQIASIDKITSYSINTGKEKSIQENIFLEYSKKVDKAKRNIQRAGIIDKKIWFYPTSIYFIDDYLFIKVKVENKSNITFDIDQFLIRRRYTEGVTASSQQDFQLPVKYTYNVCGNTVAKKNPVTVVFVFDKFTLNDKEELLIEILEKTGSRDLLFKLRNEHILNAENL